MKKAFFIFSMLSISLSLYSQPYLYGITFKENGVITKYDLKSNTLKAVYRLKESDGDAPFGNFVAGPDGSLYGMTAFNGLNNYGTIFSYNPFTEKFAKLHDFTGRDGGQPSGSLVKAANGKLYGLSQSDGAGNIFSYDPVLHLFRNEYVFTSMEGEGLFGSLTATSDGKLYGLAYSGGNSDADATGLGTLFVFDPASLKVTTLFSFHGKDGAHPYGSLILGSDKKLYGTTNIGGNNNLGVLFSFDPRTLTYKKLYDFDGSNGAVPYSNLIQASNGLLFGTTQYGGTGAGTLFCYKPSESTFVKLHDFNVGDGSDPSGTLLEASNNMLYGTTEHGGKFNQGVLYNIDPKTLSFTVLQDFDGDNGAFPHYGALIEVKPSTPTTVSVSKLTLKSFPNPSSAYFNISVESDHSNDLVELRVFDAGGKLLEVKKVNVNTVVQIGQNYLSGSYFVKALQGSEKSSIELIKK